VIPPQPMMPIPRVLMYVVMHATFVFYGTQP
jgi:hypothetical protein